MEIQQDGRHATLRPTGIEKAVFGIIVAGIVGLLSWVGLATMSSQTQLAVLSSKLDLIQDSFEQVATLRDNATNQKIEALDKRVTALERQQIQ
jgi:hypothetical protein